MLLRDHMVTTGNWLFRWRGYVLLAFLPVAFLGIAFNGPMVTLGYGAGAGLVVDTIAIAMVIAGLAGRLLTVGFVRERTSGRNTREGQVAEELNTAGMYSIVRNPLYLYNCMIYVGLVMFSQYLPLLPVFALALVLYYERIIQAEESFLLDKFGAAYREWVARVPAFWPMRLRWVPPVRAFSLRMALGREHTTMILAVVALYLIATAKAGLVPGSPPMGAGWNWALAAGLMIWLVIRIARKTGQLDPVRE